MTISNGSESDSANNDHDAELPSPAGIALGSELATRSASRHRLSSSGNRGMLSMLLILFVVSYGILTTLVFEQGQTIESQRMLIREMLKDSNQLATLKGKIARDGGKRADDKPSAETDNKSESGNSATGSGKNAKPPGKSAHSSIVPPGKPEADLQDVRRSTGVI